MTDGVCPFAGAAPGTVGASCACRLVPAPESSAVRASAGTAPLKGQKARRRFIRVKVTEIIIFIGLRAIEIFGNIKLMISDDFIRSRGI
jgi:hypothetical protein